MIGGGALRLVIPPLDIRPVINPYKAETMTIQKGIAHVYSDGLMEAQIPQRFGLNEKLYWNKDVRAIVAQAAAIQELEQVRYAGSPLVQHRAVFFQMHERMGLSMLEVLQGVVDPAKPRPYLIAPDTLLFYPDVISSPERSEFVGTQAVLSTRQVIDYYGKIVTLKEPRTAHAYIMDVRAAHHHLTDGAIADLDESTYRDFLGCVWDKRGERLRSKSGASISAPPEVEIGIHPLT